MATVQLSQSNRLILHTSLRLLILKLGSSLIAPHAYHSMPTSNTDTEHFQSLMYAYTSRYTSPYSIVAAVLRDISEGTSYQTVRLVFRHYAHLTSSSCTSERLGASSALSHTFTPNTHSSLSFGSHTYIKSLSNHDAHMVSLVRVSRRAKLNSLQNPHFHFASYPFHTSIALLIRYRSSTRI